MRHLLFATILLSVAIRVNAQDTLKAKSDTLPVQYVTATILHYTGNLEELEDMSIGKLRIADDVNPGIKEAFYTTFKNVKNAKWFFYNTKGTVYLVAFEYDERDYKALLNKDGKVFYTMFNGSEKDLSANNRKLIKAWYPYHSVIGLIKISSSEKNGFLINLKNRDELMVLSLEDDRISEIGLFAISRRK